MSDLIDTTEMYLKTVYELTEEGITPLRARIAERLGHSGPTVSQTVARMERDGLVVVTGDRHLELTELGASKAVRVMRKHRLAERLLTDVIGLEWPYVHEEACRWEHVMSERVERRLASLLDHPHFDPYGNPIPGLAEIGEETTAESFLDGVTSLLFYRGETGADGVERAVVARIAEPLQVDVELLARLAEAGVLPHKEIAIERGLGLVTVSTPGSETVLDLPDDVARHIFVGKR
ncbi:metal-dependent transcriptional regulator [uncultured Cellulomonas sp.]|uniref:metal-dependent transcriptional regulator n=1 Tax=uncultured Cellulomonas sp. TaxID=189682 RepID=UPI0028E7F4DA|nr:metal-dependent transcriptional regulator [uncultured Cellulomonas sp.]